MILLTRCRTAANEDERLSSDAADAFDVIEDAGVLPLLNTELTVLDADTETESSDRGLAGRQKCRCDQKFRAPDWRSIMRRCCEFEVAARRCKDFSWVSDAVNPMQHEE